MKNDDAEKIARRLIGVQCEGVNCITTVAGLAVQRDYGDLLDAQDLAYLLTRNIEIELRRIGVTLKGKRK